jgi:hypothetical protein
VPGPAQPGWTAQHRAAERPRLDRITHGAMMAGEGPARPRLAYAASRADDDGRDKADAAPSSSHCLTLG